MNKPLRSGRTDGEITRARILNSAGELFAKHGFAEITNKAIAARAGVDLASINYHFGSRNGLYRAVLEEAHRQLIDIADLQSLEHSSLSASEKLKMVMAWLVRNATEPSRSWHISVITAELLNPSSHIHAIFESSIAAKITIMTHILSDITGIAATDPALQRCLISIVIPGLWLQISHRSIPGPVQTLLHMPPDALVDHLHRFALGGLNAIAQEIKVKNQSDAAL